MFDDNFKRRSSKKEELNILFYKQTFSRTPDPLVKVNLT